MTINDELLEALKAASNYVDTLGGNSIRYRQVIAKAEQAERVEPAKDVNSTHTPAAWQVWVEADTPLNAPMGWQFYNTYDSLRSAEATERAINAAQQAPFAKVIPLHTTPPAAAVSEPLTYEQIDDIWEEVTREIFNLFALKYWPAPLKPPTTSGVNE